MATKKNKTPDLKEQCTLQYCNFWVKYSLSTLTCIYGTGKYSICFYFITDNVDRLKKDANMQTFTVLTILQMMNDHQWLLTTVKQKHCTLKSDYS